jgi:hypothetical protein
MISTDFRIPLPYHTIAYTTATGAPTIPYPVRLRNTRLLSIWTGANEAVGNMKLFNNHSGLRGLPCLAEGIYWATGLSLTTPFTEGRLGVNNEASPPGRHQEQAPEQRCTFSPTAFSSVQFSSDLSTMALSASLPPAATDCSLSLSTDCCSLAFCLLPPMTKPKRPQRHTRQRR